MQYFITKLKTKIDVIPRSCFKVFRILINIFYVQVLDLQTGQELGPNIKGEIYFRSPGSLMLGYLKNPDKTAQAIDSEGWLRTGKTRDMGLHDQSSVIGWSLFQIMAKPHTNCKIMYDCCFKLANMSSTT